MTEPGPAPAAPYGDFQLEIYLAGLSGIVPSLPMSFAELESRAEHALPPSVLSYVAGGAGDEHTQRANVAAFGQWGLMPRMLVGASERDLSGRSCCQTHRFSRRCGFSERTSAGRSGPAAVQGSGTAAYVGDNSYSAFTNPIQGTRYRFEVSPTFGSLVYNAAYADYRTYFFARPFTFAFRGLHYGRYGRDSDDSTRMYPIFLGEEMLLRGYGYGSFTSQECIASQGSAGANSCPVYSRLLGSRIGLVSAEFRIPVFGVPEYGLINFPYLPLTLSPFVDAGEAWYKSDTPTLSFASGASRGIVASAGLSATRMICAGSAASTMSPPR